MLELVHVSVSILVFSLVFILASACLRSIHRGSYVLSTVHAVTMLLLTSYAIFTDCEAQGVDALPHCEFDAITNSYFQQRMLMWSLGYFLVDVVIVLVLVPDYESAFHHIVIIIGQIASIKACKCGYALAWFLLLAEISAPFLNCFLSGLTMQGSKSDSVVRTTFAITFIINRLLICPFMTFTFVFQCNRVPLIVKLVCLSVMGISSVWVKRVLCGVMAAVAGNGPNAKKNEIPNYCESDHRRIKGE